MTNTSRRRLAAAAALAAVGLAAVPASAHPTRRLDPTLPADLSYAATDNVEYLGRFPEHTGTAGGRLSADGRLFYLTDPRGVHVYDVSRPGSPERLGFLSLFQQEASAALAQEDPDTNGEILLVDGAITPAGLPRLQVVDVSDPRSPRVLSSVGVTDHTWTCVSAPERGRARGRVNTCAYAYGRTGHIVDLTDPSSPQLLDETWRQSVGYGGRSNNPYTHDLTEIRPGLVMSAGSTAILMDTTDPRRPVRLASIDQEERFSSLGYHSVEWSRGGRSPYVVLGTEIKSGDQTDCDGDNSVIETWDARAVIAAVDAYQRSGDRSALRRAVFRRVDAYDAGREGLFVEGAAPANSLYCAHWMDLHPRFDRGGLMAVSYYERGTRFVDVGRDGRMTELGWIVAAEGMSGSPRWISDDVVYVMDYRRGMEVVRLHDRPAKGVRTVTPDPADRAPDGRSRAAAVALVGTALLAVGAVAVSRAVAARRPARAARTA